MSDEPSQPELAELAARLAEYEARRCIVCNDAHAPFGYTTRHGTVWTCLEHRSAGEAVLVSPSAIGTGARAS